MIIYKDRYHPSLLQDLKLKFPFIHFKKKRFSALIEFKQNCLYDITAYSKDSNKLYGLSFHNKTFTSTKGIIHPPHHYNSFRLSWIPNNGEIVLLSYQYVNGERFMDEICRLKINREYKVDVHIDYESKVVTVVVMPTFVYAPICKAFYFDHTMESFSYILGSRFGGDNPAMQTIEYKLKIK